MGAQYNVEEVQIWLQAGAAGLTAFPSGGLAVYVTQTPPARSGGSRLPATLPPCRVFPVSGSLVATLTLEDICVGQGRYVTVQLIGATAATTPTSEGSSLYVLRLCALMLYGFEAPTSSSARLEVVQESAIPPDVIAPATVGCALALGIGLAVLRLWKLRAEARLLALAKGGQGGKAVAVPMEAPPLPAETRGESLQRFAEAERAYKPRQAVDDQWFRRMDGARRGAVLRASARAAGAKSGKFVFAGIVACYAKARSSATRSYLVAAELP